MLAGRLRAKGWTIRGTTRKAAKLEAMRREGVEPFVFDRERHRCRREHSTASPIC